MTTPQGEHTRIRDSLHAQIPMTRYLGVEIEEFDTRRIVLSAPLDPSLNHRSTAFGPGVFAVAALAPWLLLVRVLWSERIGVKILLRHSEFSIRSPIESRYRAVCDDLPRIDLEQLRAGERARLSASSRVQVDEGILAATYAGHFTLVPTPRGESTPAGDLPLPFPKEWRG